MTTIGKLRIKGIRGIREELTLDLGGKSLLLRGDNGTGKSSIVQAIRWSVMGAISAGVPAVPEECQRHRLEDDLSKCYVTLDLLPEGRIVFRGGQLDELQTDDVGRAYVDACVRSNPFLRRDELVGFLTDTPADRFKYLERFLDREKVDRLLEQLDARLKKHQAAAKDAETARDLALAHLADGGGAPASLDEVATSLCAEARRLGLAADEAKGLDGLAALRARVGATGPDARASARRTELASGMKKADGLVPPDHPASVLRPLGEAEQTAAEPDLARLLAEAVEVVEKRPGLEHCPVCEQGVDAKELASRLRARAAVLDDVQRLRGCANELGDAWRDFLLALEDLERLGSGGGPGEAPKLAPGRKLLDDLARDDGDTLSARVLVRLENARAALRNAHEAIPDDVRLAETAKLGKAVDAAIAARKTVEDAEQKFARHTDAVRRIRAVSKAVGDARKDVAEEIHKEVDGLVASFYERIHPPSVPDEVTGAPKIKVKRYGAGTAHLRGVFNKEEIDDPRFLYSDGHLDTVGICIFLALRKKACAGPKLLVLDDIVLSIDISHAGRLMRVVRDEFKDHQIMILSHNELFMRMCREPFSHAVKLEIRGWTLDAGPRIGAHVSHADHLARTLEESGSAETVANAMRPLLDELTRDACANFEVKVPLTRGRGLTLDEYWGPLKKKLQQLASSGHRHLPELASIFEKVGTPSFLRNALGAHLNEWALEASLGQVQGVARALLELAYALHCTRCRTLVRLVDGRDPDKGLACECETVPSLPDMKESP